MSTLRHALAILLLSVWAISTGSGADAPKKAIKLKSPSPDKRFVLRLSPPTGDDESNYKADLIEQATGKVMTDLGTAYPGHLVDTVLVWSPNSKWVAYATRDDREGETSVYFWNGTTFEEVELPENLPSPDIHFRKGADGDVKNYGGSTAPVRWLKSGDLELASRSMMLSRVDDRSYTGVVNFTIAFDPQHHAKVHTTSKTRTHVDE